MKELDQQTDKYSFQKNINKRQKQIGSECVIFDGKLCDACGECDMCDIESKKFCDNCGKCLNSFVVDEKGYVKIPVKFQKNANPNLNELLHSVGLDDGR